MNLLQEHHLVNVGNANFITSNNDLFDGDPATDVVNLANWNRVIWAIQKGTGAVGRATVTVESCDDVVPSTATPIAFKYRKQTSGDTWTEWADAEAAGFTTTAGENQLYEVAVAADALNEDDQYVRLQLTEQTDGAVQGGVIAMLLEPRYVQGVPATVLT